MNNVNEKDLENISGKTLPKEESLTLEDILKIQKKPKILYRRHSCPKCGSSDFTKKTTYFGNGMATYMDCKCCKCGHRFNGLSPKF